MSEWNQQPPHRPSQGWSPLPYQHPQQYNAVSYYYSSQEASQQPAPQPSTPRRPPQQPQARPTPIQLPWLDSHAPAPPNAPSRGAFPSQQTVPLSQQSVTQQEAVDIGYQLAFQLAQQAYNLAEPVWPYLRHLQSTTLQNLIDELYKTQEAVSQMPPPQRIALRSDLTHLPSQAHMQSAMDLATNNRTRIIELEDRQQQPHTTMCAGTQSLAESLDNSTEISQIHAKLRQVGTRSNTIEQKISRLESKLYSQSQVIEQQAAQIKQLQDQPQQHQEPSPQVLSDAQLDAIAGVAAQEVSSATANLLKVTSHIADDLQQLKQYQGQLQALQQQVTAQGEFLQDLQAGDEGRLVQMKASSQFAYLSNLARFEIGKQAEDAVVKLRKSFRQLADATQADFRREIARNRLDEVVAYRVSLHTQMEQVKQGQPMTSAMERHLARIQQSANSYQLAYTGLLTEGDRPPPAASKRGRGTPASGEEGPSQPKQQRSSGTFAAQVDDFKKGKRVSRVRRAPEDAEAGAQSEPEPATPAATASIPDPKQPQSVRLNQTALPAFRGPTTPAPRISSNAADSLQVLSSAQRPLFPVIDLTEEQPGRHTTAADPQTTVPAATTPAAGEQVPPSTVPAQDAASQLPPGWKGEDDVFKYPPPTQSPTQSERAPPPLATPAEPPEVAPRPPAAVKEAPWWVNPDPKQQSLVTSATIPLGRFPPRRIALPCSDSASCQYSGPSQAPNTPSNPSAADLSEVLPVLPRTASWAEDCNLWRRRAKSLVQRLLNQQIRSSPRRRFFGRYDEAGNLRMKALTAYIRYKLGTWGTHSMAQNSTWISHRLLDDRESLEGFLDSDVCFWNYTHALTFVLPPNTKKKVALDLQWVAQFVGYLPGGEPLPPEVDFNGRTPDHARYHLTIQGYALDSQGVPFKLFGDDEAVSQFIPAHLRNLKDLHTSHPPEESLNQPGPSGHQPGLSGHQTGPSAPQHHGKAPVSQQTGRTSLAPWLQLSQPELPSYDPQSHRGPVPAQATVTTPGDTLVDRQGQTWWPPLAGQVVSSQPAHVPPSSALTATLGQAQPQSSAPRREPAADPVSRQGATRAPSQAAGPGCSSSEERASARAELDEMRRRLDAGHVGPEELQAMRARLEHFRK